MPLVASNTSQAPSPVHLTPNQIREHEAERNISRTEATNSQKTSPLSTEVQMDCAASSTQSEPNNAIQHKNRARQLNLPSTLPSPNTVSDDEVVQAKQTNISIESQPNNSMNEHHLPSVPSQSPVPEPSELYCSMSRFYLPIRSYVVYCKDI